MLTDADRLASLQALSGVYVSVDSGEAFWAMFREDYVAANGVDEAGPALTCRSCDAKNVRKGAGISWPGHSFRVRGLEPARTGFTVIRLGA